jgi:hypothetical protein
MPALDLPTRDNVTIGYKRNYMLPYWRYLLPKWYCQNGTTKMVPIAASLAVMARAPLPSQNMFHM